MNRKNENQPGRLNTRCRIGFLAGDMSLGGGANRVIADLANLFAEHLAEQVSVISVGPGTNPAYPISPKVSVGIQLGSGLWSTAKAVLRLRRSGADFLIGSWTQDNLMLTLACLFSGSRALVVEHTSWYFHPRWVRTLRRLVYPLAARVIVLNPTEVSYYSRFLKNVRMMPNPVTMVETLDGTDREKLIVAIGHLEARKNFQDAVSAMAMSGLDTEGWSLAIIGSGPDQADLEALIAEKGLKNTTIHAPTSDIESWYKRASLTLVTAKLEVFSLVLAEAMAAGIVPIAYAADGPAYLLEDFPEHLVPITDVEALAEKLAYFAGTKDLAPLRKRLSESVKRRFSPQRVVEFWRGLLQGLAEGGR